MLDMSTASATARRLFQAAVAEALKASAFLNDCGRTVILVFSFVLGEDLDRE
jgi:hypothetical protein